MNSSEAILALLVLASFSFFIFASEQDLLGSVKEMGKDFGEKASASGCAALINNYYANSGGKLWKGIECGIEGRAAVSGEKKSWLITGKAASFEFGGKKNVIVEVEKHYG